MLRKLIIPLIIGALISITQLASAGQVEDAWAAYKRSDYATALSLWHLLAGQGNADARNNIGTMYQKGLGVDQDLYQAVDWYRLAALQGNANGQNNLGWMYANGLGVEKDYNEAMKWYRLAAQQGNAKAQGNLGAMYANGLGVEQDFVRAYMWLNVSESSSSIEDRIEVLQLRDQILKKMTSPQIEQAQTLAKKCVELKYHDCETEILVAKESTPPTNMSSSVQSDGAVISIQMKRNEDGMYMVPVLINNAISLDFVIDSGASNVVIPGDVVSTLMRTGTLKDTDFIGAQSATLADGSKIPSLTFRIRSLKVGDNTFENVRGSTTLQHRGDLLLGQSFLSHFKSWSIDNKTHILLLKE